MREQLLVKLSAALAEPFEQEMQVVYVLVEVRKFLEQQKLKDSLPSLNFHCCWAVHSEAKGGGADRILKRFDELPEYYSNINSVPNEIAKTIAETMSLETLRFELHRFLTTFSLPDGVVSDYERWVKFLALYFSIVEDCPFKLSPNSNISLNHLKEIIVTRIRFDGGTPTSFATLWKLIGKHGNELGKYANLFTTEDIPGRLSHWFRVVSTRGDASVAALTPAAVEPQESSS